jgi:hypothetical protein
MAPMFLPTRLRSGDRALTATALSIALAVVPWCDASATPKWGIARPAAEGKVSRFAPAPLQKEAAHDKELAERYPVHLERIEVEGIREPSFRREPPRTTEQRFADALNEGSPELISGRSYDGYYYDGTLFWGSDPLSFAWKNISHWLKR